MAPLGHPQLPLIALRSRPLIVTENPSFDRPDSQVVSAEQIFSPRFEAWRLLFGWPIGLNRKLWEHLYILNAMDQFIGLGLGTRALGFGVGRERTVALLASFGCDVVATDYTEKHDLWPTAAQGVDDLFYPKLCSEAAFRSRVSFRNVDMNRIPPDLRDFDCLWSCGSLEHIGGLKNGLQFIEAAMACLRPGGIAVHTTEFNLISDELTYESPNISFYRRSDIVALAERLLAAGHHIVLNFTRGNTLADLHVDQDAARNYALSLTVQDGAYIITSIGIIVQKRLDSNWTATPPKAAFEIVIEAGALRLLPPLAEIRCPDGLISYNVKEHGNAADPTIFYGPYATLPSGSYRLSMGPEIVGAFRMRLTGDFGRVLLHEQAISSADDFLEFTTYTPISNFEAVLSRTDKSEQLRIDKIVLTRR